MYRRSALMVGAFALWLLPGCAGWNGPPAGTVTGRVLYRGLPAPGKRVTLSEANLKAVTDAAGRYTFAGLPALAAARVIYDSQGDRPEVTPNELATWRSPAFELPTGEGRELAPFDVSYNGLLLPRDLEGPFNGVKQYGLDFHWSTCPQGRQYRLRVTQTQTDYRWTSAWTSQPTIKFHEAPAPGTYDWSVEVDGGDTGSGATRIRKIAL